MNNQINKKVDLGFIYCLKHPDTKEIFYVGATESTPKDRLAGHYQHFTECLTGKRKSNKRFEYMKAIWPKLVEVEIIEIVQHDYLYKKEVKYIKDYSKIHKLTNQTKGGYGGDTFSLQEKVNKDRISALLCSPNKDYITKEYRENSSKQRMGVKNPMAGTGSMPSCVIMDKNNKFLKYVEYPYQITDFLDKYYGVKEHKKNSDCVGNISKGLKKKNITRSRDFFYQTYDSCSKAIQKLAQDSIKV